MDPSLPRLPRAYCISNDSLRALHASLLLEFTVEEVAEFWEDNPVAGAEGEQPSVLESLGRVWGENVMVPMEHVVKAYAGLEWFLSARGRDTTAFVRSTLGGLGRGTYLMPRTMLVGIEPLIAGLFAAGDMRKALLDNIHLAVHKMFPGLIIRSVAERDEGEQVTGLVMFALDVGDGLWTPRIDAELFVGLPLQMAPCPAGMPAFERMWAVADARPPEAAALPATAEIRGGRLLIDGDVHGEEVGFFEFCRSQGFEPADYGIGDRAVVLVTNDFHCRNRKRRVLTSGCVYGAPVSLIALRYVKNVSPPANPLTGIIREVTAEPSPLWEKAGDLHRQLVRKLTGCRRFVYTIGSGAITVDGRHLASKVPAKILRNILRAYLKTGQVLFEHRQFMGDPEIVPDPANPNFALRLKRLRTVLERKTPDIEIESAGRGCFRLKAAVELDLVER